MQEFATPLMREAKRRQRGNQEILSSGKPQLPLGRRWWLEFRVTNKKLEPWWAYGVGDATWGGEGGEKGLGFSLLVPFHPPQSLPLLSSASSSLTRKPKKPPPGDRRGESTRNGLRTWLPRTWSLSWGHIAGKMLWKVRRPFYLFPRRFGIIPNLLFYSSLCGRQDNSRPKMPTC